MLKSQIYSIGKKCYFYLYLNDDLSTYQISLCRELYVAVLASIEVPLVLRP